MSTTIERLFITAALLLAAFALAWVAADRFAPAVEVGR